MKLKIFQNIPLPIDLICYVWVDYYDETELIKCPCGLGCSAASGEIMTAYKNERYFMLNDTKISTIYNFISGSIGGMNI